MFLLENGQTEPWINSAVFARWRIVEELANQI